MLVHSDVPAPINQERRETSRDNSDELNDPRLQIKRQELVTRFVSDAL